MQTFSREHAIVVCGRLGFARRLIRPAVLLVAVIGLTQATTQQARAQEPTSQAIGRAQRFLDTTERGKFVLGYLHFGSTYGGHDYKEARTISRNGRAVPGHFALVYHYVWDNDGYTDVAFLCDEDGDVYSAQIVRTNAEFNQPFLKANLTIQILGNVIVEAFKEKMSEDDRRNMQILIDRADAKGMLELALRLQQSFGR